MARIRSVKPEFCTSDDTMALSRDARLTFILLWPFCDDGGVHLASLRKIKAEIYPSDEDVTLALLGKWLDEAIVQGLIGRFTFEGQQYLYVTGWKQHQRIDKPQPLRYPQPDSPGAIPDHSLFGGGTVSAQAPTVPASLPMSSETIPEVVGEQDGAVPEPLPDHSGSVPGPFPPDRKGRDRKGEEISERSVGGADATRADDRFEEFWSVYPSRGTAANPKKPAKDKFARLVKAGVDPDAMISGAKAYGRNIRALGKERTDGVAQALTFLNQERWRDLLDQRPGDEAPWRSDPRAWTDRDRPPPWDDAPVGTMCGAWRKTPTSWAYLR